MKWLKENKELIIVLLVIILIIFSLTYKRFFPDKSCEIDSDCVSYACCNPSGDCINSNSAPDCSNVGCVLLVYDACETGICSCVEGTCQRVIPEECELN